MPKTQNTPNGKKEPSSARNRLRWSAWILTYFCAYIPPLVDMYMTHKDWQWYSWLGWGALVSFVIVFIVMLFKGDKLNGTIVNCLLIGAIVNIGLLSYTSYKSFQDTVKANSNASEADRMKSQSNFLTTVISSVFAIASMIVQWLDNFTAH
ncbi:hypothetical protein BGX29_001506 [Mortierella sp. GBA35]|nr:hypothetical protein BGX29_001506 [Mortierella sp. GBA35]